MKLKTVIILLTIIAVTITPVLAGDIPAEKMVFKYHMDAMMGQPEEDSTFTLIFSEKGMHNSVAGKPFVLLYQSKTDKFYLLYPEKKEYSYIDPAKIKPFIDQQNTQMGELKLEEKVTGKKLKVAEWETYEKVFNVSTNIFQFEMTGYFTSGISKSSAMKAFWSGMAKHQGSMAKFTLAIINSKGVPVKFVGKISMMGQTFNTGSETTLYKKVKVPATLFSVPEDYKEVPLNMQHFQQAFH